MQHRDRIESEFTRQATTFAQSPSLNAASALDPIASALARSPRGTVLDVACGPGIVSHFLAAHSQRVVGIDVTAAPLQLAQRRVLEEGKENVHFARALAEALPLREASLSVIVARLFLHHVEDPGAVLRSLRPALRADGRLLILDLLSSDDPEAARIHNAIEQLRDPSHVRAVSRDELVSVVEEAGYVVRALEGWETTREYEDWATIIADPTRMAALETVLRELVARGCDAGIELRVEEEQLRFRYRWVLLEASSA